MAVNIGALAQPQLYNYGYDQLNRITRMDVYRNLSGNSWASLTSVNDYKERVSYDGNGNIKTYLRNGAGNSAMDNLSYQYYPNTNLLRYITDAVTTNSATDNDLRSQNDYNYGYDSTGNLSGDNAERLSTVWWNVYGKILTIVKDAGAGQPYQRTDFVYDPSGNRVGKDLGRSGQPTLRDWYVRDAQGNVMAVYRSEVPEGQYSGPLKLVEHHVYGSARLGIIERDQDMDAQNKSTPVYVAGLGDTYFYPQSRGYKRYELSNHLGNVLVTISDRKVGHVSGSSYDYYTADIINASDYYPFGMQMPGRKYPGSGGKSYRYGFNGQEKSDEIKGEGNSYTAEFWEYDPRSGRRWNVDPAIKSHESGYMSFAGNPIWFTDPNGSDTTKYYNTAGDLLMTLGNGKAGYNRAMVVKDDKLKAIQDYASKYADVLNSGKAITNSTIIDENLKDYGDLYDLNSFTKFYEDNKGKYSVVSMRGHLIDDMSSITVNGKPVSKTFIKNLKGAEATAVVKKVGGIFTVDVSSTASDGDAFQGSRPYSSDMSNQTHIHLHPFWNMNIEYRGKGPYGSFFGYEPAKGVRDGSITGDIEQNSQDGRRRTLPRTVIVSDQSIRLITGTLSETIYIKK